MSTQIARSTNSSFEDTLQQKFYAISSLKKIAGSVTYEGFKEWLDTPEGIEGLVSYRRFLDHHLDATCTRVIDESLELLMDRLQNGDICYTDEGEPYRVEIRGISLAKIFAAVFDRRQLIRKNPTKIIEESTESLDKIADILTKLSSRHNMVSVSVVEKKEISITESIFDGDGESAL